MEVSVLEILTYLGIGGVFGYWNTEFSKNPALVIGGLLAVMLVVGIALVNNTDMTGTEVATGALPSFWSIVGVVVGNLLGRGLRKLDFGIKKRRSNRPDTWN